MAEPPKNGVRMIDFLTEVDFSIMCIQKKIVSQ